MARLLPNPGKAMLTCHRNSERRLATALLEKTKKKRSLVSRMCGCFSHCVLLPRPPGSRGERPGRAHSIRIAHEAALPTAHRLQRCVTLAEARPADACVPASDFSSAPLEVELQALIGHIIRGCH